MSYDGSAIVLVNVAAIDEAELASASRIRGG